MKQSPMPEGVEQIAVAETLRWYLDVKQSPMPEGVEQMSLWAIEFPPPD